MKAALPVNEAQRIASLQSYDVLDTENEIDFDDLALLASQICQTPIALVSFVDEHRQWFKSKIGLSATETPRDYAFCAHAILVSDEILEVKDARLEERFLDNPLVTEEPNIVFYAGTPLVTPDHYALGTLCVIDYEPRVLSDAQKQALRALGRHVVTLLTLRKSIKQRKQYEQSLRESEERFQDLVESANDLIQICDMNGSLLYANRAWRQTLHYSENEIPQLGLSDIIQPSSFNQFMALFQKVKADNKLLPMETVLKSSKGDAILVEGNSTCRYKNGKPFSIRSIFRDISARRHAEKERDRLFNYALDLYCIAGFDGYFKQVNPAWQSTLGWSSEELLAKPYMEFVHPDDHDSTQNAATTIKDGKNLLLFDNRYLSKDGSYRWLTWVAYPQTEEGLIFAIARDVTDQKNAQAQLQQITEQRRAIIENAGYAIISTTPDGIITSFNPAAERMLGYSAEEVINLQTPAIIHKPSEVVARAEEFSIELGETIEPGFEVFVAKARLNLPNEHEWTYIHKNGAHFPVILSVTALRDSSDKIIGFLDMAIDITERKKMQLELEQFKYTLDQTVDCVFICNTDTFGFEYVNEGAKQQVGYSESELLNMVVPDIKTEMSQEQYQLMIQPLLEGKKPSITFQTIHQHKDGRKIDVEVTTQLVQHNSKQRQLISIVRDITERKRAEELLRTKNEELKGFAYTVSHDLKAPLRGISGYAQELERKHQNKLTERAQFCIKQIISASHNLDGLIEDLLTYSRVDSETLTVSTFDIEVLIKSIMRDRQLSISEQGVKVSMDVPSIKLHTWERGLHQVLTNLIDNAIKYSRNAKPPRLDIRVENTPSSCLIVVKDNGVGFDMKYHDRIFGLFNRLVRSDEFEGTGAGLAIVSKLLNKLGGSIRAESKLGLGATFFIEFPIIKMRSQ